VSRDVITEDALIQVAELNYAFLQLMRRHIEGAYPTAQVLGLRHDVAEKLRTVDEDALRLLAQCSYALFDLRLADGMFWRAVRGHHVPDAYSAPAAPDYVRAETQTFTQVGLLYAWHLARTHPLAARLMLGMSQQTVDSFAGKSVVALGTAATMASGLLTAVHCENRVFWPDLIQYAVRGTPQQFEAAVRLGSQLIAVRAN
jgi:hypothetical protein